jgi:HAD superfamily hydrolase (TIGR01509 family)
MTMFPQPIEAVIFDMDGLLLDTEAVYERALMQAALLVGSDMPETFCRSMIGMPGQDCDALIQAFFGSKFPLVAFNAAFERDVERRLEAGVPVKAGAAELLDRLAARGLPTAIATSSSRRTAEHHLGRSGLIDRFAVVVTRDDVDRGKPHPDLYLEAAKRLGIAPERCLALEDSHHGIVAAHAAGTMAVMVPDMLLPTDAIRRLCVLIAQDLHEVRRLLERPD